VKDAIVEEVYGLMVDIIASLGVVAIVGMVRVESVEPVEWVQYICIDHRVIPAQS
jgi:hypothetical protein